MQKKIEEHIFQGMQRDTSISKLKPEYLWDANNIRLTSRHGDTLLSMTNERGTAKIDKVSFTGVVLGYCIIGNYLTIFTTDPTNQDNPDYIYKVTKYGNNFDLPVVLYNGNLKFSTDHPIETLGIYENEDIQKVYWTDGINQPRVINIVKEDTSHYISTSFDFIPTLSLKDSIQVEKVADSSGIFPAGVILYAVTYYNKYGLESNVSLTSPLIPTSYTARAGSPEENIGNAFKVTIKNPDTSFEYLRLYSIFRSSKDTTPVCKRVADVKLSYSMLNLELSSIELPKNTTKSYFEFIQIKNANNQYTAQVSTDWGLTFKSIDEFSREYRSLRPFEELYISINGVLYRNGHYWHFTKSLYPGLVIKAYRRKDDDSGWRSDYSYFMWGDAKELYIAEESETDNFGPLYAPSPSIAAPYNPQTQDTLVFNYFIEGPTGWSRTDNATGVDAYATTQVPNDIDFKIRVQAEQNLDLTSGITVLLSESDSMFSLLDANGNPILRNNIQITSLMLLNNSFTFKVRFNASNLSTDTVQRQFHSSLTISGERKNATYSINDVELKTIYFHITVPKYGEDPITPEAGSFGPYTSIMSKSRDMKFIVSDTNYQKITVEYSAVTITDNGTIGNDVDHNEILFVGGEEITAQTITQKDGTMFLGGITIKRPQINGIYDENGNALEEDSNKSTLLYTIKKGTSISKSQRSCWYPLVMNDAYQWGNPLWAKIYRDNVKTQESTNTAGFKYGEHYRLGLQFQYKTGKWSQPVFIKDEVSDTYMPSVDMTVGYCRQNIPTFNAQLSKAASDMLIERGYMRVRSVVCFPTLSDQRILCQGILNTTVYNVGNRANHTPDSQSSWFFRPIINRSQGYHSNLNIYIPQGEFVQYRHGFTIEDNTHRSAEIQSVEGSSEQVLNEPRQYVVDNLYTRYTGQTNPGDAIGDTLPANAIRIESLADYTDFFVVDANTVTMNSPEFEFNDSFKVMDLTDLKCRCIGKTLIGGVQGDIYITTSSAPISSDAGGFYHRTTRSFNSRRLCAGLFYRDGYVWHDYKNKDDAVGFYTELSGRNFVKRTYVENTGEGDPQEHEELVTSKEPILGNVAFMVYPWHRSGSLNNDCARSDGSVRSSVLEHKVISNLMFSYNNDRLTLNQYHDLLPMSNDTVGSEMKIFNSDQINLVKIGGLNYFGNIDLLISPTLPYPICFGWKAGYGPASFYNPTSLLTGSAPIAQDIGNIGYIAGEGSTITGIPKTDMYTNQLRQSSEGIMMKYKSVPHAVLHLGTHQEEQEVVASDDGEGNVTYTTQNVTVKGVIDTYPQNNPSQDFLYLAEIYRDDKSTDFGGKTQDAIQANIWYPAGPAVRIGCNIDGVPLDALGRTENDENYQSPATGVGATKIPYWYGDTYFARYDCLKTYPFTDEDPNSIIEIGSFLLESRINLDGRYDKNRGDLSNFMLNPTVFNRINPVYSLMDNFFNYRILDDDYYALSKYPTMVTWTGYKNNAAEVDSWTNITLASTLEMDGTKGKVNAVRVNSDLLYCFQDDAIGQILFNSRVQISPSDGVPIEISNNYKVDGNRYISTNIGCKNKWSIIEGVDGLYFIDDNTKALYLLGGQSQLKPISTPLNMSYWFTNQDFGTSWIQSYRNTNNNIISLKGVRCFYDNCNSDLYITTPTQTLCYSEKLGQFVSFFDYHNVIGMFNIDSDYYALNYPDSSEGVSPIYMWDMFRGKYNTFFNKVYPTDFTFISNENPLNDKIFSNIEVRGDFRYWPNNEPVGGFEQSFNSPNHQVAHRKLFDTLQVWNEYQDTGSVSLNFEDDTPSNLKKKFRIWRMDIPRDSIHSRQRMRNTWTKVKFTMNNPNNDGSAPSTLYDMEIHDVGVVYFV